MELHRSAFRHVDFALWALLRMNRLLPFVVAMVLRKVPLQALDLMEKTKDYINRKGWR